MSKLETDTKNYKFWCLRLGKNPNRYESLKQYMQFKSVEQKNYTPLFIRELIHN